MGLPEMNRLDAYRTVPHPGYISLRWCCCFGGLESAAEGFAERGAREVGGEAETAS